MVAPSSGGRRLNVRSSASLRHGAARLLRAAVRRWASGAIDVAGWPDLLGELDRWRGAPARFWWRDDDATTVTPPLLTLLDLRARLALPLAVAVIPATAHPSLAAALPETGTVLVHGWSHANHAGPGRAPAEFAAGRAPGEVLDELHRGLARLAGLFGARALPVLVPPFNQFDPGLAACVRQAGYTHVSVDRDFAGVGLRAVNVHADVIDWQAATAAAPRTVVRSLVTALRLRRFGLVARDAPIGIMTHHGAHDGPAWHLTETILTHLKAHRAASFPPLPTLFAA